MIFKEKVKKMIILNVCVVLFCYIILCICFYNSLSETTGDVFLFDDIRFAIGVPVFILLLLLLCCYFFLLKSIFAIDKGNGLITFHSVIKKYPVRIDDIIKIKETAKKVEVTIIKGNRHSRIFMYKTMGFEKTLFTGEEVRSFISNNQKSS